MQALQQSSSLRGGLRQTAAPIAARPTIAVFHGGAARLSPQQRSSRDVVASATAAEIEDMEFRDLAQSGASSASSGLPVMPSEKVKLRVRMRGYNISILADACQQVMDIARVTGAKVAGPVNLPTRKKIYCVLRSPHVDKDAREHFEVRTHHRLVDLSNLSAQTVQALMEWVPPSGLEVETSIC